MEDYSDLEEEEFILAPHVGSAESFRAHVWRTSIILCKNGTYGMI